MCIAAPLADIPIQILPRPDQKDDQPRPDQHEFLAVSPVTRIVPRKLTRMASPPSRRTFVML